PHVSVGRMLWPAAHAQAAADAYREITATAPDTLTVWFDLLHFPGADPMIAVDSTYLGNEDEARALLRPLDRLPTPLSDTRRAMQVSELGSITAEPTDPSPGMSRAELLTDLDDATLKALLAEPIAPLLSVQVRQLGGAFTRPSDSPHGPLTAPHMLYLFGALPDPSRAEPIAAKQRALAEALPTTGRKPFTFLNPAETIADAFTPETVTRLRDLKLRYDPHNVIRSNFPVR
ncbi:FAD-linked oxidase, partial [Actinomadura adrarensis]